MSKPASALTGDDHHGSVGLRGNLTTSSIALLIIAAAAPLGVVIGQTPVGFMLGNGPGLAGTFILAGLLIVCFAAGYSALIRDIPGAGAFYNYLSVVFGKKVGTGAALVALAAYLMNCSALAAGGGYFTDLVLQSFNIHIGWKLLSACYVVVVAILGRSNVDIAAKFVVPLVLAEFAIIILLAVAIIYHKGMAAFPYQAVAPTFVFKKGFGFALMTGLSAFIGVESAALYVLEARDPSRAIPRATLGAVILISIAYLVSIWTIVGAVGANGIQALAAKEQGDLVLGVMQTNAGEAVAGIAAIMVCTSVFACYLSLHNAATRYVFTLAQRRVMPGALAVVNPKHGSPSRASLVVTIFVALVAGVPALLNVDPYTVLFPSEMALSTIGIIALQAAVAIATIVHFRRKRDSRVWVSFVYPLIGAIGLLTATWLIASNYPALTGSTSVLLNSAPILLLFVFLYGWLVTRSDRGY
ncbi:APC family permease [Paraburkholderia megapolitana]|uniref:APC family permease n=1 Tax=Paraburkholderia megapolitana TaxID=420953 RepID=UPI0038BC4563